MFVTPQKAMEIIHKHGADKVFFGTDSPMWRHKDEFERFNKLTLTPEERKMILSGNALKFFHID